MNDIQLLHQFVRSGEHAAFEEIVRRHVDLVYAAARRQANGDGELAEEITQRVFILLSQKAARLKEDVILGGWLFNSVRFVAQAEMRRARRRSNQERKAAAMAEENRKSREPGKIAKWDDAESVLDEAMGKLDQQARGILVLRYFEGKTAREVGDRLGISEEAARKRTSRAIEQLRGLFARSGVIISAPEIAQGLALPVMQAPAHVAASAASARMSSGAAAASASGSFLKGAVGIMAYLKTQTAVVAIVYLILIGGAAVGVVEVIRSYKPSEEVAVVTPKTPTPIGPTISGIVRGVDGKPIAGATVFVATEQIEMFLPSPSAGGLSGLHMPPAVLTDANGKYVVGKPGAPYAVFVTSNAGYAQASWKQMETVPDLVLRPWGRIEGIVKVGDRAAAKADVQMWRIPEEHDPWEKLLHIQADAQTDANGRYVFPQVPPGEMWLSLKPNPTSSDALQWRYLQVESGQTENIQIGGEGYRVTGHVVVPAEITSRADWKTKLSHSFDASYWRTDLPNDGDELKHDPNETPEQFTEAELRFGQTAAGKLIKRWPMNSTFTVNPDGTFVINDLPAGKYKILIRNLENVPGENFMDEVTRGEVDPSIGPPVGSGAAAGTTIDLGPIPLQGVEHHALAGQVAPDFTTTTIDGKTWKLADQKGKVVVLFFWATYRQDMGEDQFAVLANKWEANPDVSILGLCMTDESDEKKQIESAAAKMKFHFPEAAEGELLLGQFDSSYPEAVLIDRSGKIVQKYLSWDSLEQAMENEMAK